MDATDCPTMTYSTGTGEVVLGESSFKFLIDVFT